MEKLSELSFFLVDSNDFYLEKVTHILQEIGCDKITPFEDASSCLNRLQEKPDVIFLDSHIDNTTGFDIIEKIKRVDPNIFVIIHSDQKEIDFAVDSLKKGAFDYIQKGEENDDKIKEAVKKIIAVRKLLKKSKPSLLRTFFSFL